MAALLKGLQGRTWEGKVREKARHTILQYIIRSKNFVCFIEQNTRLTNKIFQICKNFAPRNFSFMRYTRMVYTLFISLGAKSKTATTKTEL